MRTKRTIVSQRRLHFVYRLEVEQVDEREFKDVEIQVAIVADASRSRDELTHAQRLNLPQMVRDSMTDKSHTSSYSQSNSQYRVKDEVCCDLVVLLMWLL